MSLLGPYKENLTHPSFEELLYFRLIGGFMSVNSCLGSYHSTTIRFKSSLWLSNSNFTLFFNRSELNLLVFFWSLSCPFSVTLESGLSTRFKAFIFGVSDSCKTINCNLYPILSISGTCYITHLACGTLKAIVQTTMQCFVYWASVTTVF